MDVVRCRFGFIFPGTHLVSHLTGAQNVESPAVYAGIERKNRQARAREFLSRLGIRDLVQYPPQQRSGGQHQRVTFTRRLAICRSVILAAAPTALPARHCRRRVRAAFLA
ncbi:ATP-binding cassette domain-containing protein, partial [Salmonella enterica]|uniref:ATP-binding cassette domain-containing protein n=1 Tax=Salmonella enterica TaxID=28901 RepID=UPI00398C7FA0